MNTSRAVKQMHEMTHTAIPRIIMQYEHQGERFAKVLRLDNPGSMAIIERTLRFACHKGVEITFRPA